jgi:signal transduction histidine kinase
LDDAPKIATFRIIQEALNNIIKHAEAKIVHIDLTFEEKGMHIKVRDDGCGFDLEHLKQVQTSSRPALGLAGMQERAVLLGGSVHIQSKPGQGTLIEASIPYHYESEEPGDHTSIIS